MTTTARAALSLTTGRTIGFIAAFAIPLVLARSLSQEAFGTYKYLFLMYSTLGFMQLGMAESLYFFVPARGGAAGRAVANAVVTLAASGVAGGVLLTRLAHPIARLSGEPGIAAYLPLLGLYLGFMIATMPLEIVMVSRKQYGLAACTYAAGDILRAALLALPGLLTRSVWMVMAGAVGYSAARALAQWAYVAREFRSGFRLDRQLWAAQLRYALPFTLAVTIEIVQINFHQYVVWGRFDAATFAIYAAGCLQIPLVDILSTSTGNVMMVRMAEERHAPDTMVRLWYDAVTRLAFVFLPLAAALVLTSHDLIVTLFTARYAASAPVFAVSTGMIAITAFPVDSVLRVYAQTRFLVVMNLIRLTIIATGIFTAVRLFGLTGAIGITVIASVVAKSVAVWRIGRLFGVPLSRVLPWRALATFAALAGVSLVPAAFFHRWLQAPPLLHGAATAAVYGAVYLASLAVFRAPWRAGIWPWRASSASQLD